jgi:hypothetical protein
LIFGARDGETFSIYSGFNHDTRAQPLLIVRLGYRHRGADGSERLSFRAGVRIRTRCAIHVAKDRFKVFIYGGLSKRRGAPEYGKGKEQNLSEGL